MEFSKQEYESGLPFPSPGDLLDPGMEPGSPALQEDSLLSEPPGKPFLVMEKHTNALSYYWLLHCQLCGSRSTAGTCSPMAQWLKNRPTGPETWVRSLGQEDPWRRKGMVTHSSILAWKIPWTEEPGRLQSTGSRRVGHS